MRVDFRDLVVWSFLMASAHGAGLMLIPILLRWPTAHEAHSPLLHSLAPPHITTSPGPLLAAVGVHTLSLFLVTGAVAMLVYEKLGLALLRQAWFNLDLLWAVALLVAGIIALVGL
jgi:hypothetical protein